jgi:hypothetical protein
MSAREWKPGDVAMVDAEWTRSRPFEDCLAVLRARGWERVSDGAMALNANPEPRGVAVIDPEDAEQVGRLLYRIEAAWVVRILYEGMREALQAALREFANPTPPKPDEPTGLGAVVETANGYRWLHAYCDAGRKQWIDKEGRIKDYEEIAAVRVLSEGVPS